MSGAPAIEVTLKLATSLDGRIATAQGESRWITGEPARAVAHTLRAAHDAVAVGSGTALADDPELTARIAPPPERQPVRIALDSDLRLPPGSRLASTVEAGAVVVAAAEGACAMRERALAERGVEVWRLPRAARGPGLDLEAFLDRCRAAGLSSLLVEGGGELAASFVRAGLVARVEWFRAPILLGDDARAGVGPLGLDRLDAAAAFRRTAIREVGADVWESYVRR
jgi:diaminohydroxyphosphoribosylaminopyrimidine deaminase/5-amino-6-(5-phosphoribosylamino)uracil reductase